MIGWNSPRPPDRLDGGEDVADAPRAGDHEHGAVVGVEAEAAAHRGAVDPGVAEPLADQRPVRTRVLAAACRRRLGRELAHREVAVDAAVDPERVDGEVGEDR